MTDLETKTRDRVRHIMQERLKMTPDQFDTTPSGYCFRLISARMCILVHEHRAGQVLVQLHGIVGEDMPFSAQLCEYVATHGGNWIYGHLNAVPDENGDTCTVLLRHTFADNHVRDEVLEEAIRTFARTLEELDDTLVATFGGHRKYEDV